MREMCSVADGAKFRATPGGGSDYPISILISVAASPDPIGGGGRRARLEVYRACGIGDNRGGARYNLLGLVRSEAKTILG